jgi:sugar phosphate isomerase/epimerase
MQPNVDRSQLALELGIFAKTFRRSSIDEIFDAIASYGLTCTQWNWACVPGLSSLPEAVPRETSRAVARAASRNGTQICAVSATFNIIQPGVREEGLARLPALAEAAVSMGCHLLTLCTGTRHPTDMWAYHPDNGSREAWADMINGLREASRIASQYGVRLAIEPETANVVADARSGEAAFEELGPDAKTLSIILDAANLYRPPVDPRGRPDVIDDALAQLGRYISLAHAKDIADPSAKTASGDLEAHEGHYTHVAAGTGILPYAHYLSGPTRYAGGPRLSEKWETPTADPTRPRRRPSSRVSGIRAQLT